MNPQALIDRCEQQAKPTAADITNSIATADHVARLAGLPTYTELAQALRKMTGLAVPQLVSDCEEVRNAVTLACRIPS